MTTELCPPGATLHDRESNCPFRADIAKLSIRLDHIDQELASVKHSVMGNGRPGILEQARLYSDSKDEALKATATELAKETAKSLDTIKERIGNLKVWLGMLAASGGAIGSVIAQAISGGG